jgi:hypothetical protein
MTMRVSACVVAGTLAWAALAAAQSGGSSTGGITGPKPGSAPTPPARTEPTAGQPQTIEGTVEAVRGDRITVRTPNERVEVDVSRVAQEGREPIREGTGVTVTGVMGPEREVMVAVAVRQRPDLPDYRKPPPQRPEGTERAPR